MEIICLVGLYSVLPSTNRMDSERGEIYSREGTFNSRNVYGYYSSTVVYLYSHFQ